MPVLIDTNVLSDVIHEDSAWSQWAERQLESVTGELVINPNIYAELCAVPGRRPNWTKCV